VPEKDGILACLLMAELVATEKKSLGQILRELSKQIGNFYTDRINVAIPPDKKDALLKKLAGGLKNVGPFKVEKFITTDGYKFSCRTMNGSHSAPAAPNTHPLLHRGEVKSESEEARHRMPAIVGGLNLAKL